MPKRDNSTKTSNLLAQIREKKILKVPLKPGAEEKKHIPPNSGAGGMFSGMEDALTKRRASLVGQSDYESYDENAFNISSDDDEWNLGSAKMSNRVRDTGNDQVRGSLVYLFAISTSLETIRGEIERMAMSSGLPLPPPPPGISGVLPLPPPPGISGVLPLPPPPGIPGVLPLPPPPGIPGVLPLPPPPISPAAASPPPVSTPSSSVKTKVDSIPPSPKKDRSKIEVMREMQKMDADRRYTRVASKP
jgi:hypothetical protein